MTFVHFHSYPILSRASQEKVREIAALLAGYQLRSRLLLVPFGELQQQVVLAVRPELRVVVYRRLMMRIAERLARRWRARALVTGDMTHHPVQWAEPDWKMVADTDPEQAVATRRRMRDAHADRPVLVIGTHYATPCAGYVVSGAGGFTFRARE